MCNKCVHLRGGAALLPALILLFMGSCGEVDVLLPSAGSYQVGASAGGWTLAEKAFLSGEDEIEPFCTAADRTVRDIDSMVITILTEKGASAGPRYVYKRVKGASSAENTDSLSTESAITDEVSSIVYDTETGGVSEIGTEAVTTAPSVDTPAAGESSEPLDAGETAETTESALSESGEYNFVPAFDGTLTEETTGAAIASDASAEVPDGGSAASSEAESAEAESEKPAEIAEAGDGAEEASESEEEHEEAPDIAESEAAEETAAEETAVEEETLADAEIPDVEFEVTTLQEGLPSFKFPENAKSGIYHVIFQLFVDDDIIVNVDRPVFFLAGKEFSIGEIQSYQPGAGEKARTVYASQKILLQTSINYDKSFSPWVVWSCAGKKITEGLVSGGFNTILWKSSEKNGFQTLKAEVFPSKEAAASGLFKGLSRELSLSISTKTSPQAAFAGMSGKLSQWFLLWGDLTDSRKNTGKASLVTEGKAAKWAPSAGTYGLSLGAGYEYSLPSLPFRPIEQGETSGTFLFRFTPTGTGGIVSAVLPLEPDSVEAEAVPEETSQEAAASETTAGAIGAIEAEIESPLPLLELNLSYIAKSAEILFTVTTPAESAQKRLPLARFSGLSFITGCLDLRFLEDSVSVSLGLAEDASVETEVTVELRGRATGEGVFSLGSDRKGVLPVGDEDVPSITDNRAASATAILTELAVLYPALSHQDSASELPDAE